MSESSTTDTETAASYSLLPTPWKSIDPYLIATILLSLFALGPLVQPGYHWGAHDARSHVYFLFEFNKSIQDGILWPRWGPDWGFGYGYPFWNIYGPLAYYVGEGIHLLGFDYVPAVKMVFALSILGSAATMYLFVRRLLGRPAGLLAGLVYVYVPYRLFDLYVRAALAEAFSFVLIPLVLWGFLASVKRPRISVLIGTALAYAGLVLSSNAVGLLLITPTVGLLVLVLLLLRLKDDMQEAGGWGFGATLKRLIALVIPPALGLTLGLGLLAFFVLPLVLEYNYVRVDQWTGGRYAFGGDFVYLFQLFSPRWGFGASIPGPDDLTGFQLGLVPLTLFVLSFLALARLSDVNSRRVLRFFQALILIVAFLMTPASAWIWQTIPLSSLAQFPWRLGVLTTTGLAVVAGAVVSGDQGIRQSGISESGTNDTRPDSLIPDSPIPHGLSLVILAALVILGSYPYLRAEVRNPKPDEGPVSLAALFRYQQSSDEMTGSTAWTRRIPGWSVLAEQVVQGGEINTKVNYTAIPPGEVLGVHSVDMDTVHELVWVYAADDQRSVTFFIPYYPGWTAYVYKDLGEPADDLKARVGPLVASPPIHTTPDEGWMVVPVPPGEHFLEVRFEDTPVRIAGKWISLLALLVAVTALIAQRIRRRSRE
jgi:hypothetical protein